MHHDFWMDRWQRGQIGFHEGAPNALLAARVAHLGASRRVLVPLCGKAEDMAFLAAQGHTVVGVELAEMAVTEFFAAHGLAPTVSPRGALRAFEAGPYTLLVGDFFAVTPDDVGPVDALYDRAALIALPPAMRRDYAAQIDRLVPQGAPGVLVTLEYPDGAMEGPPFSVPESEVRGLYATRAVTLCTTQEAGGPRASIGAVERCYTLG